VVNTYDIAAFLAAPEKITPNDAPDLQRLVDAYPYFQPLRLLLAKATIGTADESKNIASAALYTNGQILHTLLHNPDALLANTFQYDLPAQSEDPETAQAIELDEVAINEVDEQETFDEIGEVNISDYVAPAEETISDETKLEHGLVLENIVATDFFAFQDNFQVESIPEIEEQESAEAELTLAANVEDQVISKYDDDKLPYTFLWWLAKTRKEHQQIFQPYAAPKQVKTAEPSQANPSTKPSELQQQYVEHIFHLQTPFNAEELVSGPLNVRAPHRGSDIIENFIKNEPQIRTPRAEQINNDNKARKSAEDHNDMVTETLAKIYIEQMLYDKAIQTYEKLSLKFPEKSRYFADLIQSIQKKI